MISKIRHIKLVAITASALYFLVELWTVWKPTEQIIFNNSLVYYQFVIMIIAACLYVKFVKVDNNKSYKKNIKNIGKITIHWIVINLVFVLINLILLPTVTNNYSLNYWNLNTKSSQVKVVTFYESEIVSSRDSYGDDYSVDEKLVPTIKYALKNNELDNFKVRNWNIVKDSKGLYKGTFNNETKRVRIKYMNYWSTAQLQDAIPIDYTYRRSSYSVLNALEYIHYWFLKYILLIISYLIISVIIPPKRSLIIDQ